LGNFVDLASPHDLASVAITNSIVVVSAYLAVAALVWAFADATMPQPLDFGPFPANSITGRTWRVAHLSDIHVVGERYGFRIEGGRSGPRGNGRLNRVLELLDVIHTNNPLDFILITGDMTDAGRSAEWSELLKAFAVYPRQSSSTRSSDEPEQKVAPASFLVGR
jgi:predicted MPP superfamily phosphohydrolase